MSSRDQTTGRVAHWYEKLISDVIMTRICKYWYII